MNQYKFQARQEQDTGKCFVIVEKNGETIEVHFFETPEWALFFKSKCEALDAIRYPVLEIGYLAFMSNTHVGTISYFCTKEEVDTLIRQITSFEYWLEPLRNKVRRFFDALMWGERGRV